MNSEELKKKIKKTLRKRMTELLGSCHTDEIPLTEEGAEAILFYADEFADALIAAGLRFGENLTATFDRMALEREHDLERCLAEAEHRAEVTEKKYRIALTNYAKLHREATRYNKMTATYDAEITKQAEEELKRESKD